MKIHDLPIQIEVTPKKGDYGVYMNLIYIHDGFQFLRAPNGTKLPEEK